MTLCVVGLLLSGNEGRGDWIEKGGRKGPLQGASFSPAFLCLIRWWGRAMPEQYTSKVSRAVTEIFKRLSLIPLQMLHLVFFRQAPSLGGC